MSKISVAAAVRAPSSQVWDMIADVGTIASWHPGVAKSAVLSGNRSGLGAKRRLELYQGGAAVEEVTAVVEGSSVTLAMSDHTMPLSRGEVAFELRADGDERTQVTMSLDYDMKYGPLGWLMNLLVLRPIMRKLFGAVIAGLEHHLLTGEKIGQNWKAPSA